MKDIVTLPDDGLKFKDYQREILSRSLCGFFLPVTFLTSVREGKPVGAGPARGQDGLIRPWRRGSGSAGSSATCCSRGS